ncbi:MAG: membrane protein insertase YidC [Bauldia sp.]|nr:membrane protein insertase YidC [Bauldia sp.]
MQEGNNRNFIIAIVLSLAVLIGWQYFVAQPQIDRAREEAAQLEAQQTPAIPGVPGAGVPGAGVPGAGPPVVAPAPVPAGPTVAATRAEALGVSARVPIDTPAVTGSINLTGARIDDLHLMDYRETVDPESDTVTLLSPANGPGGYYAEFGWVGAAGGPAVPGADTVWSTAGDVTLTPSTPVVLTWDNGAGLLFTRTIAVDAQYMFTVSDSVTNSGAAAVSLAPYARVERIGEPPTQGFFILHEGFIGVFGEDGLNETAYKTPREDGTVTLDPTNSGWLGITDKYWATALIPAEGETFTGQFAYRNVVGAPAYQANFLANAVTIAPGTSGETMTRLFAGAKQVAIVDGYDNTLGIDRLELLIDWGWFYFITKPMFYALDFFNRVLGNFGLAILAVTVLVKLVFFPLANRSYASMSSMRKLQPQMMALRERYKDDRVKQQQALMELYKKEKINPIAGCWPVLLQIPVFFALYKVLFVTIEMRHAPFFGWIQDLSARDPTSIFNLFGLIPWAPPEFLHIGIWPIIMGVTMWVQMRLNPVQADPTQRLIFNWMPVLFTFMLAAFPAGLVIYWAWNNLLSLTQQWVIMKRQGVEVDLFGNIMNSFRRKGADKPDPAKTS